MDKRSNVSTPDVALVRLIKARREQMGISQGELAQLMTTSGIRMSQSAISRIELEERALTVGEAQVAADLLHTTLEELLRSDPADELTASLSAALRAAGISRRNALSALEAHTAALGRVESALGQLQEAIDRSEADAESTKRLVDAQHEAHLVAQEYISPELEMTLARAMDDLGTTTTYSAAVEHHHAQFNDG